MVRVWVKLSDILKSCLQISFSEKHKEENGVKKYYGFLLIKITVIFLINISLVFIFTNY